MLRSSSRERDDDRRLADDAVLAVDDLGELGERLQAVAGVRLGGDLLGAPSARLGRLLLALPFWARSAVLMAAISSSSERCAYQMSMVSIAANSAIAVR